MLLDRPEHEQIIERAPKILQLLTQRYRLLRVGPKTAWHERREE